MKNLIFFFSAFLLFLSSALFNLQTGNSINSRFLNTINSFPLLSNTARNISFSGANACLSLVFDSVLNDSNNIETDTIKSFTAWWKRKYDDPEIIDTSLHNWSVLYYDSTTQMHHLSFVDENTGWVIGDKGLILKTTDGGLVWEKQNLERNLYDVCFIDNNTGYLSSDDFLYRTINGGNSWDTVNYIKNLSGNKKECSVRNVCFKSGYDGFIVVRYIHIDFDIFVFNYELQETTDAGKSWNVTYLGYDMSKVNDIYKKYTGSELNSFDNSVSYYLSNNVLYKTNDNGTSRQSLYPPALSKIFFVNKNVGYAVSAKGKYILKTIAGGE